MKKIVHSENFNKDDAKKLLKELSTISYHIGTKEIDLKPNPYTYRMDILRKLFEDFNVDHEHFKVIIWEPKESADLHSNHVEKIVWQSSHMKMKDYSRKIIFNYIEEPKIFSEIDEKTPIIINASFGPPGGKNFIEIAEKIKVPDLILIIKSQGNMFGDAPPLSIMSLYHPSIKSLRASEESSNNYGLDISTYEKVVKLWTMDIKKTEKEIGTILKNIFFSVANLKENNIPTQSSNLVLEFKKESNYLEIVQNSIAGYGADILSNTSENKSLKSMEEMTGTSMAAPSVTGNASFLKLVFKELSVWEIKQTILRSAKRIFGLPSIKIIFKCFFAKEVSLFRENFDKSYYEYEEYCKQKKEDQSIPAYVERFTIFSRLLDIKEPYLLEDYKSDDKGSKDLLPIFVFDNEITTNFKEGVKNKVFYVPYDKNKELSLEKIYGMGIFDPERSFLYAQLLWLMKNKDENSVKTFFEKVKQDDFEDDYDFFEKYMPYLYRMYFRKPVQDCILLGKSPTRFIVKFMLILKEIGKFIEIDDNFEKIHEGTVDCIKRISFAQFAYDIEQISLKQASNYLNQKKTLNAYFKESVKKIREQQEEKDNERTEKVKKGLEIVIETDEYKKEDKGTTLDWVRYYKQLDDLDKNFDELVTNLYKIESKPRKIAELKNVILRSLESKSNSLKFKCIKLIEQLVKISNDAEILIFAMENLLKTIDIDPVNNNTLAQEQTLVLFKKIFDIFESKYKNENSKKVLVEKTIEMIKKATVFKYLIIRQEGIQLSYKLLTNNYDGLRKDLILYLNGLIKKQEDNEKIFTDDFYKEFKKKYDEFTGRIDIGKILIKTGKLVY